MLGRLKGNGFYTDMLRLRRRSHFYARGRRFMHRGAFQGYGGIRSTRNVCKHASQGHLARRPQQSCVVDALSEGANASVARDAVARGSDLVLSHDDAPRVVRRIDHFERNVGDAFQCVRRNDSIPTRVHVACLASRGVQDGRRDLEWVLPVEDDGMLPVRTTRDAPQRVDGDRLRHDVHLKRIGMSGRTHAPHTRKLLTHSHRLFILSPRVPDGSPRGRRAARS